MNGLGAGFIGGISVGSRVIAYRMLLVKKPSCSCITIGASAGECFSSCSAIIQVGPSTKITYSGPAEVRNGGRIRKRKRRETQGSRRGGGSILNKPNSHKLQPTEQVFECIASIPTEEVSTAQSHSCSIVRCIPSVVQHLANQVRYGENGTLQPRVALV